VSDQPKNVIEALCAIRRALPGIAKSEQAAAAQGGYAYRGIESITAAIGPLLGTHGVVMVPKVVGETVELLSLGQKPWTDTLMQVVYRVYGPGGPEDLIEVGPLHTRGRDNSDKGPNKCMTQAYKQALLQLFCIGDSKDDADQASHVADAPEPVTLADAPTHEAIRTAIAALDPDAKAQVQAWWTTANMPPISKADRLSEAQADTVLAYVESLDVVEVEANA
jgi:hypothetical protein